MFQRIAIVLAFAAAFGFASLGQASLINFETYTTGNLAGQDGWTLVSGVNPQVVAKTLDDPAGTGAQWAGTAVGYQEVKRTFMSDITPVTTFSFRLSQVADMDHPPYTEFYLDGPVAGGVWGGSTDVMHFGIDNNSKDTRNRLYYYTGKTTSTTFRNGTEDLVREDFQVNATIDFAAQQYSLNWTNLGTSETYSSGAIAFLNPLTLAEAQASGLNLYVEANCPVNVAYLDNVGVVPEPASMMMLGTGLVGLLAYAWRKRK